MQAREVWLLCATVYTKLYGPDNSETQDVQRCLRGMQAWQLHEDNFPSPADDDVLLMGEADDDDDVVDDDNNDDDDEQGAVEAPVEHATARGKPQHSHRERLNEILGKSRTERRIFSSFFFEGIS